MTTSTDLKNTVQQYLKGQSNPLELARAMELFADPYHNLGLRPELYKWWMTNEMDKLGVLSLNDPDALLDKIHHRINLLEEVKSLKPAKNLIFQGLKIAAVLILGLFAGLATYHLQKSNPVYYTSIAPTGSISQMVLPDNTLVYLNSGSEIRYSIEGKDRKRELFLKGEAWFDVTQNRRKPFVVHTSAYSVEVLGTRFNVKAYPGDNEIVTTLEKGRVQIFSSADTHLKTNETLNPGQQLVFSQSNDSYAIKDVNTKLFTGWKENKLIFINANLRELIVMLERKFGVDIEVEGDVPLDYHYDGTIKNETILEVLELIKETLPVKYKIEGQKIIIKNK